MQNPGSARSSLYFVFAGSDENHNIRLQHNLFSISPLHSVVLQPPRSRVFPLQTVSSKLNVESENLGEERCEEAWTGLARGGF